MGRSVSTPAGAISTVFLHRDFEEQEDWGDFIDDVRRIVQEKYPSFVNCKRWIGREDLAILKNWHARVTVSEYCGIVAICMVPADDTDLPELADAWCRQVGAAWETYVASRYPTSLTPLGTASNGVTFYRKVE